MFFQLQRPPGDPLLVGLPLVVGHHQIQLAVVRLVDLLDGADVGVVQRRRGLGFQDEPLTGVVVARQLGWQQLKRDMPIEVSIEGLVDDPHPAATQLLQDCVVREGLAFHHTPLFLG